MIPVINEKIKCRQTATSNLNLKYSMSMNKYQHWVQIPLNV